MADPIRRFLGISQVEALIVKQGRMLVLQKQLLDKATSYLEFSNIIESRIKASEKYPRFQQLISLLSPMDILGAKYRRVGRDHDGGYVMLDSFSANEVDAAYSFGISNDVSWDESIANRGIDIFMYDHTIHRLPSHHPRFHFFRTGVTGHHAGENLATLSSLISKNAHQACQNLLLKMDVEGCEWDVLEETPSSIINQFSQMVIELHGLRPNSSTAEFKKVVTVLKKINQTHQSVHVHANGFCEINWLGNLALPTLLEVTFVRRSDYKDRFIPNKRTFPTEIDQPTFDWLPDVPLGTFSVVIADQSNVSMPKIGE